MVVGRGLVEESGNPEGSGTVLGYGAVSQPGAVSDSGVSSDVGERRVGGTEESEVSSLGKVGGGVEENSGVTAGTTVVSGVDKVRPGVVKVRSEVFQEARSGPGGEVSGG